MPLSSSLWQACLCGSDDGFATGTRGRVKLPLDDEASGTGSSKRLRSPLLLLHIGMLRQAFSLVRGTFDRLRNAFDCS